jgi:hypothetical protein
MAWIPKTSDELLQALADGTLPHETAYYEYKQQLPHSSKNSDIAVDVSAMTVEGGVIVYGVAEDKSKVTFTPHPIGLSGVQDRISNTVVANVRERPAFNVRLLSLPDDAARGFVVVEVPASPRAPHMVEVNDVYRFYGRVPGGNTKLTETEVSRLYERRRVTEDQGREIVDAAIAAAPVQPEPGVRGDLHVVLRPILGDSGIRLRAFDDDDGSGLVQAVINSHNSLRFRLLWDPHVADILSGAHRSATLDGVTLANYPTSGSDGSPLLNYYARLEVLDNGLTRYFRAAIAGDEPTSAGSGQLCYAIRDPAASQITVHLAHVTGAFLRKAQYQGLVDVYVAILGGQGAISSQWAMRGGGMFPTPGGVPQVATDDYRNEVRVSVDELADDPVGVSVRLLSRLLRTISPNGMPDPLQLA